MSSATRRDFVGLMAAGTTAAMLSRRANGARAAAAQAGGDAPRPNVLFLFSDDQRFDTIRALGNEHIITPNLDALVRSGVSFTHAHIMGGNSGAVCVPSRAMLLTGRTLFRAPHNLGDLPCFPEVLREAGYTTFGTGKWHNRPPSFARCFSDGASIFFGGMSDHLKVPVHDFDPTGEYPREQRYTGAKFSSELFSDAAVQFLREYRDDKPFLLYVSYTAPHDPRMAPQAYADMYDPEGIPLPPNFMPEHPFDNGEMSVRDEKLAPWPRTPDIVRRHTADYYAMITHLDAQIGRVLTALQEAGHADNTLIVFAGDNGLAVGQHGLFGKQSIYEHSVRVPLIISGPGLPKGRKRDALCYLLDIFPTICELTDVPAPETVEGQSLVPVLIGRKRRLRDHLFLAYKNMHRAVRERRYKLIEYFVGQARTTQLFDLANDPWEKRNLAEDPKCAGHLTRLRDELAAWQEQVEDPLLEA